MKPYTKFLVVSFALALPAAMEARTWKEAGSDRTLEGEYSKTEGENVVIIKPNGSSIKIPLAKLSEDDREFVAAQAAAKPEEPKGEDKKETGSEGEAKGKEGFKWETDLATAKKRAKEENKKILADFTGSDWCGWCIRLKKEVFDTPEFQEYAAKNLIMLELDFPKKTELPAELKAQNDKLAAEFQVQGFPTVLLLNSRGKEIARTGYEEGGPENYIQHLKKLLR